MFGAVVVSETLFYRLITYMAIHPIASWTTLLSITAFQGKYDYGFGLALLLLSATVVAVDEYDCLKSPPLLLSEEVIAAAAAVVEAVSFVISGVCR